MKASTNFGRTERDQIKFLVYDLKSRTNISSYSFNAFPIIPCRWEWKGQCRGVLQLLTPITVPSACGRRLSSFCGVDNLSAIGKSFGKFVEKVFCLFWISFWCCGLRPRRVGGVVFTNHELHSMRNRFLHTQDLKITTSSYTSIPWSFCFD